MSAIPLRENQLIERQRAAKVRRALVPTLPIIPALLLLSILIPTDISFYAGSLRLTPYRIVLLLTFIPAAWRVYAGRDKTIASDWLMLGFVSWSVLALAKHHGPEVAIESGGIFAVEGLGPYLIARAFVRTPGEFRGVARALVWSVILLLPFVAFEAVTGKHVIRDISSGVMGRSFYSPVNTRYGFERAFGPFDHPIHLGVFAASAVGLAWNSLARAKDTVSYTRVGRTIAVMASAMSSFSSGAMATISTQFLVFGWERFTRGVQQRWMMLTALLISMYIMVDILSNRSGAQVLLARLTFSASTAYGRLMIFDWGFHKNVVVHPIFGIGFNEWVRPSWMVSGSVDNYWLVIAMRYGVPAFLMLSLGTILIMVRAGKAARRLGPAGGMPAMGWIVSIIGVVVAGATVHFWNALFVYFSFFVGLGACLASPLWQAEAPRARRSRPQQPVASNS